jgi:stage IV sporulation protein FB
MLNVGLAVFNLVPAFPMDGGRMLRAILAAPLGLLRATRVAVGFSTALVISVALVGFVSYFYFGSAWLLDNPMLILIGVFVIFAGQNELVALERRMHRQEEDAEFVTPEIMPDPRASAWRGEPRSAIMVYIWNPRLHRWVPQGAIPSHPDSDRGF